MPNLHMDIVNALNHVPPEKLPLARIILSESNKIEFYSKGMYVTSSAFELAFYKYSDIVYIGIDEQSIYVRYGNILSNGITLFYIDDRNIRQDLKKLIKKYWRAHNTK